MVNTITISLDKAGIFNEVGKRSDYIASNLIGADPTARERMLATDSAMEDNERFFDLAMSTLAERLRTMYGGERPTVNGSALTINVSVAFDKSLQGSVAQKAHEFLVASILGYWFAYSNKTEAQEQFAKAGDAITGMMNILYSRVGPKEQ